MKRPMRAMVCGLTAIAMSVLPAETSDETIIAVSGSATTTVVTDELSISFDLSTESASFSDAKADADKVVERIRGALEGDYADRVQVSSQVIVLKQKKIAWSSKAKRLDHRIRVIIGGLHDSLPTEAVRILDRLLTLDPRLEVTEMEGRLSDDRSTQVRAELLIAALQDAKHKADLLAKETGQRISTPRVVHAAPGHTLSANGSGMLLEHVTVSSRSYRVTADLVGEVEMSVQLVVEFPTARL